MEISRQLVEKDPNVVGVPKTIDNVLDKTVITFGFKTSIAFATECLVRLHSTALSHPEDICDRSDGKLCWLDCSPCWNCRVFRHSSHSRNSLPSQLHREKIVVREEIGRKFTVVVVTDYAQALKASAF